MALKEDPEDGYNWRKYGQKDILYTKHPRYVDFPFPYLLLFLKIMAYILIKINYSIVTAEMQKLLKVHLRRTNGCLAMKQIQRSDEDPFIFDITYQGIYTCYQEKMVTLFCRQRHQTRKRIACS